MISITTLQNQVATIRFARFYLALYRITTLQNQVATIPLVFNFYLYKYHLHTNLTVVHSGFCAMSFNLTLKLGLPYECRNHMNY